MLVHWIWLAQRHISGKLKWELLKYFSDPEDIYCGEKEDFRRIRNLKKETLEALMDRDLTRAQRTLDECNWKGIHILTIQDAAYPRRLKEIPDPPVMLYYKGTLPDFDALPAIGIVGTRNASDYGIEMARKLGCQIGAGGGLVVSGLAKGIDAAGMEGALLSGSPTVGVLGCGVDVIYPPCNEDLYWRTEQNGCLLSEFEPGAGSIGWHFLSRNRIVSGMSRGLVVVEAPEKSGSMSTARLAGEQGRTLFAVPGGEDDDNCRGSNRLLRSGAKAVTNGWEVLREYECEYPGKLREAAVEDLLKSPLKPITRPENPAIQKKFTKINIDNQPPANYIGAIDRMTQLSPEEQAVLAVMSTSPRLTDDVIRESGLPAGKALGVLTMLELQGKITRVAGGRVKISE